MPGLLDDIACPDSSPALSAARRTPAVGPRAYRGCTATAPRRGVIRTRPTPRRRARKGKAAAGATTAPSSTANAARGRCWRPREQVVLELPADAHLGVACWTSRRWWLGVTVPVAYALRYHLIRSALDGGISRTALLAVATARAAYADHATGRGCRPSNARLMADTGLSRRQVQRADKALRLLGVATEVLRGRRRSRIERMASWRVGDRGRGWTSVWVLHSTPDGVAAGRAVKTRNGTPPGTVSVGEPLLALEPITTNRSRGRRAWRRAGPDAAGVALAKSWRAHDAAPAWARRHSPHAWAALLAAPARCGWTARDLTAAVNDWLGTGHRIPDQPHKPIGLMGAILAGHGDFSDRPTALDDARQRDDLASRRTWRAAVRADAARQAQARQQAKDALDGPGRAACRQALRDATSQRQALPHTLPHAFPALSTTPTETKETSR